MWSSVCLVTLITLSSKSYKGISNHTTCYLSTKTSSVWLATIPVIASIRENHPNYLILGRLDWKDLFIQPHFSEDLRRVGTTATGERRRFTDDQLQSVRETGEFQVRVPAILS